MEGKEQKTPVAIEDEMRRSYLAYALSVIIARALPDVRDGLKPVHRRILYSMYEQGNAWNRPYRKSARIVGDVIGKYHPHGDTAIYDALVRLAQDFSLRNPLIDGQGNFGSLDGDPPAAYRYTEARQQKLSASMLADIEKETVDFVPNYDGQESEPTVLPTRLPQLLVNGASGIAVGMSTNIPPHNLKEVVSALVALADDPEMEVEELMEHIPGPDFPTGGYILGCRGIREAYTTGRGVVVMRGKANIEALASSGRSCIVISEIPYQVNKARLVEKVADLVRAKKVDGIADIRDESDRDGIRIVVELRRDAVPMVVLNNLYKHTPLQSSFGAILLSLVENRPLVLDLKSMLSHFLTFRKEVVVRRTRYELRKAEERAHILEGLRICLDNLDEVIELIRSSATPKEAHEGLRLRFKLSEIQAQHILDLRLHRLTQLEREKIMEEYREVLKQIARLKEILGSDRLVIGIVKDELQAVADEFGDDRRTEILPEEDEIVLEDLIAEEDMVLTVTNTGYVKRTPLSTYRRQRRGGKGRIGMKTRHEDFVEHLFVASTHDYVLVFTAQGQLYWLKVYDIPEVGAAGRGKAIVNLVPIRQDDKVAGLLKVREFEEGKYVVFATRNGTVKRTTLQDYRNVRSTGIRAIRIAEGDELETVRISDGSRRVFLATRNGLALRCDEEQVRVMGRDAIGVRGIAAGKNDRVVAMEAIRADEGSILTVTERGYGKRTAVSEYRLQGRGGKGLINIRVTKKNGPVAGVMWVDDSSEVIAITAKGKLIRTHARDISLYGRATQGVRVMELEPDDSVVAVVNVAGEPDA